MCIGNTDYNSVRTAVSPQFMAIGIGTWSVGDLRNELVVSEETGILSGFFFILKFT